MTPEHEFSREQRALYEAMSEISEDCWSAGWMMGNEYAIWHALHGGGTRYGVREMDRELLDRCKELSGRVGGWIIWLDDRDDNNLPIDQWGPYFVAMDQWLAMRQEQPQ